MAILFFDTETTGLVDNRAPETSPTQPHLVELGVTLWADDGSRELACASLIVKPDGWEVPAAAAAVHGVTTELAREVGVPLVLALATLNHLARAASKHVAHNVDFDLKVLGAAYHRAGRAAFRHPMNPSCTKRLAAPVVNLPPTERMIAAGFNRPKDPTLSECWKHLFGEELAGAHGALADARGCARVYFELVKRGAVSCPTEPPTAAPPSPSTSTG